MSSPNEPTPPRLVWGPELRSWVSLALFVHLFAIVVAATTYTRPSTVQTQLHRMFGVYLRNLHMTAYPVTYPFARYHLTHASPSDVDFTCEVDVDGAPADEAKVLVPKQGLFPPIRERRYQSLANAAGSLATSEDNSEGESILPRAIAGAILKQKGASQGVFRCKAHFLPELEQMTNYNPQQRGDLDRDVYEAQVFINSMGGVEILKKSTTLEVSPVEGAAPRSTRPALPPNTKVPLLPTEPNPAVP